MNPMGRKSGKGRVEKEEWKRKKRKSGKRKSGRGRVEEEAKRCWRNNSVCIVMTKDNKSSW
jgi:hypothetical protein